MSKTKTTATQKPKITSTFADLYKIDVNDYTEQKGGLTYLSWSWAWAWTKKHYPDATYSYYRNPETNLPYSYQEGVGAFCHTSVTIKGETLEMWLPVMTFKNSAEKQPDSVQINKTLMRCLTKNLAMFGLGLYVYEGEDMPFIELEESNLDTNKDKLTEKAKQEVVAFAKQKLSAKMKWTNIRNRIVKRYYVEQKDLDEIKHLTNVQ